MTKYTVTIPIFFDEVEAESADKALHKAAQTITLDPKKVLKSSEMQILVWDAEVDESE